MGASLTAVVGLSACAVDDRTLTLREGIGADGGTDPYDASFGSGGAAGQPDVGVSPPPPEDGGSDTGSAPSSADAGCVHVGSNGKPDCDETLALNADFNRSLAKWVEKDAFGSVKWSPRDSQGKASSGSIAVTNTYEAPPNDTSFVPAAAEQCVAVTPGRTYAFSAEVFIPAGQPSYGQGAIAVWFYDGANCGGGITESGAYLVAVSLSKLDTWGPIPAPGAGGNFLFAPGGAQSMSIRLVAQKPGGTQPFQALFDAVRVVEQP